MTGYKLTDHNMQTFDNFQWELNVVKVPEPTKSKKGLCGPGWLHFYTDPLVGLFMNPIHAGFMNPRLFECSCKGKILSEPLKSGCTQMTLLKELDVFEITLEQRIKFGILCALEVCQEEYFVIWAQNWLNGSDRTARSAYLINLNSTSYAVSASSFAAAANCAIAAANVADASDINYANKNIDFVKLANQALEP